METAIVNAIEPGDKIVVLENGVWGVRASDVAERCGKKDPASCTRSGPLSSCLMFLGCTGADVVRVVHDFGVWFPLDEIEAVSAGFRGRHTKSLTPFFPAI